MLSALRPTQELESPDISRNIYLESEASLIVIVLETNRNVTPNRSQLTRIKWTLFVIKWFDLTRVESGQQIKALIATVAKMMDSLTDQLCLQDLVAATSVGSHHQPQGHHQHHHNVQIPDTTTHMQSSGAVQNHNNSPVSALTAPSFASPHHHVTTLLPPTMSSHHHHLHHLNHLSSGQTMTRTGLLTTNGTDQQPCSTTMHENNKHKRGMHWLIIDLLVRSRLESDNQQLNCVCSNCIDYSDCSDWSLLSRLFRLSLL